MFPGGVGYAELMMFGIIALLLFGKKLPEVARSLGKGVTEFKKGIRGFESEINQTVHHPPKSTARRSSYEEKEPEFTAPRFDPPTSAPVPAKQSESAST